MVKTLLRLEETTIIVSDALSSISSDIFDDLHLGSEEYKENVEPNLPRTPSKDKQQTSGVSPMEMPSPLKNNNSDLYVPSPPHEVSFSMETPMQSAIEHTENSTWSCFHDLSLNETFTNDTSLNNYSISSSRNMSTTAPLNLSMHARKSLNFRSPVKKRKSLIPKSFKISGKPLKKASELSSESLSDFTSVNPFNNSSIFSPLNRLCNSSYTDASTLTEPSSNKEKEEILILRNQLQEQVEKYERLQMDYNDLQTKYEHLKSLNIECSSNNTSLNCSSISQTSSVTSARTLKNVVALNAKFIKLYCRIRDYTSEERQDIIKEKTCESSLLYSLDENDLSEGTSSVLGNDEKKVVICKPLNSSVDTSSMSKYEFHFDKVFGPSCTNQEVFSETFKFIKNVLEQPGHRVSLLAYGATGSGKTFTIQGLLIYIIDALFQSGKSIEFNCTEIYNEQCVNLNDPDTVNINTFLKVVNPMELDRLLEQAKSRRKFAETEKNKRSSRSHCLYRFKIVFDEETYNILNLIDLAGSERLASDEFLQGTVKKLSMGQREVKYEELKQKRNSETIHINKSLSSLSQVIKSLVEGKSFVNYRDAMLTKILRHDLTQVALIVNIKPPTVNCFKDKSEIEKIVSSLTFAKKATTFDIVNSKKKR
ncbi:hypothetical protein ABK040_013432 [Willaertia magna]